MCDYQVGVFPVTKSGKLVLVTTRSSGFWIFPKGKVEPGRSDRSVARDEAYEEAGLVGTLQHACNKFKTPLGKADWLHLYLMQVEELLEQYPEKGQRERVVVSFARAEKMVQKDLREVIRTLRMKVGG